SLDHHAAFGHLDLLPVYFKFNHDGEWSLTYYRSIFCSLNRPPEIVRRRPEKSDGSCSPP
ncbi:hypothetical protein, partial [Trinickia sp.]|uniref:hypothetical protein n=1 Tax=Trinickia sp. TaxID=2571163 RepID=UPI003F7D2F7A